MSNHDVFFCTYKGRYTSWPDLRKSRTSIAFEQRLFKSRHASQSISNNTAYHATRRDNCICRRSKGFCETKRRRRPKLRHVSQSDLEPVGIGCHSHLCKENGGAKRCMTGGVLSGLRTGLCSGLLLRWPTPNTSSFETYFLGDSVKS